MRTILSTLALLVLVVCTQAADYNFALLHDEQITIYNTASTTAIRSTRRVTGLSTADEDLEGFAFRPSNNQIYALSELGYLYTINPSTMAATQVGRTNCSIETTDVDYTLSFNPVGDALRILGADGSNRRVNPANAVCFIDSPIVYFDNTAAIVQPAGVAYSNQVSPASTTSEYFLDENNNGLGQIFPFNAGNATLISTPAGIDFSDRSPMSFVTETATDGSLVNTLFANIDGYMYRIDLPAGTFTRLSRYATDDVEGLIVFPPSFTIPEQTTSTTGAGTSATTGTSGAASLTAVAALTLTAVAAALF